MAALTRPGVGLQPGADNEPALAAASAAPKAPAQADSASTKPSDYQSYSTAGGNNPNASTAATGGGLTAFQSYEAAHPSPPPTTQTTTPTSPLATSTSTTPKATITPTVPGAKPTTTPKTTGTSSGSAAAPKTQPGPFGATVPAASSTGSTTDGYGVVIQNSPPATASSAALVKDAGTGPGGIFEPMSTGYGGALVNDQTSGTYGVMNGGNMTAAQAADYAKTVNNPNAANNSAVINWSKALPGAQTYAGSTNGQQVTKDISSGNYAAAFALANSTGGGAYLLHGATLSGFGGDSINTSQQYAAFYAAAQPYIAKLSGTPSGGTGRVGGGGGPSDLNTEWGNDTSTSATTDYNTTKGGKGTDPDLATYASNDTAYEAQNRDNNIGMGVFTIDAAGMFLTAGAAGSAIGGAMGLTGTAASAAGGATIAGLQGTATDLVEGEGIGKSLVGGAIDAGEAALKPYVQGAISSVGSSIGGSTGINIPSGVGSTIAGGVTGYLRNGVAGAVQGAGGSLLNSLPSPSAGSSFSGLGGVAGQIAKVAAPTVAGGVLADNTGGETGGTGGYWNGYGQWIAAGGDSSTNTQKSTSTGTGFTPTNNNVTPLQAHIQARATAAQQAQTLAASRAARKQKYG